MSGIAIVPDTVRAEASDAAHTHGLFRRLLRRPLAVSCLVFLLLVTSIAIVAPIVLPDVAHQGAGDLNAIRKGPSAHHLLGTDGLGRDLLNRVLVGTRITMVAVAEGLVIAVVLGVPLGLAAGYLGGRLDQFVSWLTDLAFAIPGLIIVLVVITVFPRSTLAAMVTLGALSAPGTARMVRAVTLPVREELYIAAARVSGLSRRYIISRHVLPRIAGVVIVQTSLLAAAFVIAQSGLAFLGLLGDPTAASWGGMLAEGTTVLQLQPWLIWPPGIAIGLTVLAFTLLGDALRDATTESWSAPVTRRRGNHRLSADSSLPSSEQSEALLSVERLTVGFPSPVGSVAVVEGVSFEIREGEVLGLVGESGCGKTTIGMAILGLIPGLGRIEAGRIAYRGRDLVGLSERQLERVRGREIGLISQEPGVSMTPTFRVGWQIAHLVRRHQGVSRTEAHARTIELLRQVRLPDPEVVAARYVHELSGGMAQRVAIARALAGEPKLLIADEPTTALDVTVQDEILELMRDLQRQRKMSILLITHDWGVIADLCDRALVMYAGEVVEQAPLTSMFRAPLHPYTEALLASNPHHVPEGEWLPTIPGSVPKPGVWPEGCHFQPRCTYATDACRRAPIALEHPVAGRETRCIHYDQLVVTS